LKPCIRLILVKEKHVLRDTQCYGFDQARQASISLRGTG
jgi:hypothetical protein